MRNRIGPSRSPAGILRNATRFLVAFALGAFLWIRAPGLSEAADPNALWTIVHGLCVTDQQAFSNPSPCSEVDLKGGYAVLKDIRGATQYLLIPTTAVSGVESPKLLVRGAPNYFAAAWKSRVFVEKRLGRTLPREDIGLAINSAYGRSQNQLHIHIDCVRPDVRDVIARQIAHIGRRWTSVRPPLAGHRYRALRIDGAELGAVDPFQLLARTDPQARSEMARETLVLIGATVDHRPAFVLLNDRARAFPPDRASGEELLDHSCRIAR